MKENIQTSINALEGQISTLGAAIEQTDNNNSKRLVSCAVSHIETAKLYLKEAKDLGYTEFILESPKGCEDNTSGETPTDDKAINFPLPTVEEVQEKIAKSLIDKEWRTKYSAIKMIDEILLPTLGSEADIKFWNGISDLLYLKLRDIHKKENTNPSQPSPTLLQIEAGIKSTGKYRQEDGYSLTAHQAYVDGWYDAIDFTKENAHKEPTVTLPSSEYEKLMKYEKFINTFLTKFERHDVLFKPLDTGMDLAYKILDKVKVDNEKLLESKVLLHHFLVDFAQKHTFEYQFSEAEKLVDEYLKSNS